MDNIERRLHDAKLGAAIDNAAAKLPPGYEINIVLERHGVIVELFDDDGEQCYFPSNHETMADEINDAVEFAIEDVENIEKERDTTS